MEKRKATSWQSHSVRRGKWMGMEDREVEGGLVGYWQHIELVNMTRERNRTQGEEMNEWMTD